MAVKQGIPVEGYGHLIVQAIVDRALGHTRSKRGGVMDGWWGEGFYGTRQHVGYLLCTL
jgi:hypothetical protein